MLYISVYARYVYKSSSGISEERLYFLWIFEVLRTLSTYSPGDVSLNGREGRHPAATVNVPHPLHA